MIKYILVIAVILIVLVFENCSQSIHVSGKYSGSFAGIAGEEINFAEKPDSFEYSYRSEGGLLSYSTGSWIQSGKQVFLNGFNKSNIKTLQVESKINDSPNEMKDEIVVRYKPDPLYSYTRVELLVNDTYKVPVSGDTTLWVESKVQTIQVKSYLDLNGILPSSVPKIDTLLSQKIKSDNQNSRNKIISVNVSVSYKDFYRTELNDTVLVKNSRTLLKGNRMLRKVR